MSRSIMLLSFFLLLLANPLQAKEPDEGGIGGTGATEVIERSPSQPEIHDLMDSLEGIDTPDIDFLEAMDDPAGALDAAPPTSPPDGVSP